MTNYEKVKMSNEYIEDKEKVEKVDDSDDKYNEEIDKYNLEVDKYNEERENGIFSIFKNIFKKIRGKKSLNIAKVSKYMIVISLLMFIYSVVYSNLVIFVIGSYTLTMIFTMIYAAYK